MTIDKFTSVEDLKAARQKLVDHIERQHLLAGDSPLEGADADRFNEANAKLDEIDGLLEQRQVREERLRAIASRPENREAGSQEGGSRRRDEDDQAPAFVRMARDVGLRTIERFADRTEPAHLDRLDGAIRGDDTGRTARYVEAVGRSEYRSAFCKLVLDPLTASARMTDREREAVNVATYEQRAIGLGTTGVPVPYELDPTLLFAGPGVANAFRAVSRVEMITEGAWKGATTTDAVLSYSAEAVEATDNTTTLVQPSITAARCVGFIPFSIEVGQDWNGIVPQLTAVLADGKNDADAGFFLTGTGTNQPSGVLTGLTTTQRIQTATIATYALGDPWLLKAAIAPRFYANSTFFAAPGIWDVTYRFVGGNSAEPVQFDNGRGGGFLGLPKQDLSSMVTTTTTGSKIMLVGDFSNFLIADRLGMSVELIPQLFGPTNRFPSGQRGLVAYWRTGSGVLVPNAFRYLEVK